VVDASIAFGSGENFVLEVIKKIKPKAILLINKIDKVAKQSLLPIMDRYSRQYEFLEILPISALKKDNLDILVDKLFEHLPEGGELYDSQQVTDQSERFLSAEFIREKLLERTREEIPYATAVRIKRFDESRRDSKKLVVIEADIVVEKRSQQGIILGAGGLQLRNIGISARRDLEQLLDCRIYLDLNVCTVRDWRNNDSMLDELGL
jgi:GTP-binding protein Era